MTDRQCSTAGLDSEIIDTVALTVPGGIDNVQDIYPLSPLQEGMLFHRILHQQSDTYVLSTVFELASQTQIELLRSALQTLIGRHDALRTAVLWERLPHPVQVVCHHATLPVERIVLDRDRDLMEQLRSIMSSTTHPFDLTCAPLMRLIVADRDDRNSPCHALLQVHHIVCDHQSLRNIVAESLMLVRGDEQHPPPPECCRDHVVQARAGTNRAQDEAFFRAKLHDVDEPTAPFGLVDVYSDGSRIDELCCHLDEEVAQQVRRQAHRATVSPARLFHAAWALVVARISGRDDVLFGTVVLAARQRLGDSAHMVGMFVNTLPLRLRLRDLTVAQLVQQTDLELKDLLQHEHASLTLAQRCSGILPPMPLITALFNFRRSAPLEPQSSMTQGVRVLCRGEAWSSYPISVTVDDLGSGFSVTAQVDRRIGPQRILDYLDVALRSLTEALKHDPGRTAMKLPVLTHNEWRQVVESFNQTDAIFPAEQATHTVFEEQVRRAPQAAAIFHCGVTLTYAELNQRANQLARYLRTSGVRPGDYVPVLMARSLQMIVAQLALLKSGAVYVPIDPDLPAERRAFIIRDCNARLILINGVAFPDLQSAASRCVDCAALESLIADEAVDDLNLLIPASAAAYVMYTSGSTGVPKGVVVPHRAVNRLAVNGGYAEIGPGDCIAHHSNPSFDASTFEIWTALLNGARVVVVPQPTLLDAPELGRLLIEQNVTALYMSAGLFNQYTDALANVFPRLRYLFVGGEALEPTTVRRVLNNHPPLHMLNVYGPTECTTFASKHVIREVPDDARSIPIGSPISNTKIYITDRYGQPQPIGVAGELHIGGPGVAAGYLNRSELTSERFLHDPFSRTANARCYKTGDVGRWREDGTIEYLGRNDQQVKVRGFRIEPGEVEAHLLRDGRFKEAVVVVRQDGASDKQLVAYVVPNGSTDVTVGQLRAGLKAHLPEYMVPSALVLLDQMPLTSTGKVDRRALPAPQLTAYGNSEYEPPQGKLEEGLAQIWRDILRVEKVGRTHNFFETGGNSLNVMRLIVRIAQQFAIPFSAQVVFANPTLMAMADAVLALQATQNELPTPNDACYEEGVL